MIIGSRKHHKSTHSRQVATQPTHQNESYNPVDQLNQLSLTGPFNWHKPYQQWSLEHDHHYLPSHQSHNKKHSASFAGQSSAGKVSVSNSSKNRPLQTYPARNSRGSRGQGQQQRKRRHYTAVNFDMRSSKNSNRIHSLLRPTVELSHNQLNLFNKLIFRNIHDNFQIALVDPVQKCRGARDGRNSSIHKIELVIVNKPKTVQPCRPRLGHKIIPRKQSFKPQRHAFLEMIKPRHP